MWKRLIVLVGVVLFLLGGLSPIGGVAAQETVLQLWIGVKQISVNGALQNIDASPFIREDRTMVPIRFVSEALGASVVWINEERKVEIAMQSYAISLWVDHAYAVVNGQEVTLDVPPIIVDNRTFVPIRFVSENLGAQVKWSQTNQRVTIATGGTLFEVGSTMYIGSWPLRTAAWSEPGGSSAGDWAGTLQPGAQVTLLETREGWARIKGSIYKSIYTDPEGQEGWVPAEVLLPNPPQLPKILLVEWMCDQTTNYSYCYEYSSTGFSFNVDDPQNRTLSVQTRVILGQRVRGTYGFNLFSANSLPAVFSLDPGYTMRVEENGPSGESSSFHLTLTYQDAGGSTITIERDLAAGESMNVIPGLADSPSIEVRGYLDPDRISMAMPGA